MREKTVDGAGDLTEWLAFAENLQDQPLFQTSRLLDALAATYPIQVARIAIVDEQNDIVAAACVYYQKNGGKRARLFVPRLGIVATNQAASDALLGAIAEYAKRNGIVQCVVPLAPGFEHATYAAWQKMVMVCPLSGTGEDILGNYRWKTRQSVRKAADQFDIVSGPVFIGDFHRVYSGRMASKAVDFHSIEFFERAFASGLPLELLVARRNREVQAGMVFLRSGTNAFYLFNGATPEGLRRRANHLLMWHGMSILSKAGATSLDMGESTAEGGVFEFKRQFGAIADTVNYCDVANAADEPAQSAGISLTRRLGLRLINHLPENIGKSMVRQNRAFERLL